MADFMTISQGVSLVARTACLFYGFFFQGGLVASPPKAKVAKVVQPESEESSSESSESEEKVIK